MKTKRLIMVLLSVLLVVSLSVFAFACKDKKEPTPLTIDSDKQVTIEVGQEYTLLYTSTGTVTVTASGGNYNAETHKFSADKAGEYVLDVSAIEDGKAETKDKVEIKVVDGADKSAITAAIEKTKGLIAGDYTSASWAAMNSAKKTANEVLGQHGVTAELVASTAKELEDKIKALVPAEIAKAEVTEDGIVNGDKTYFAEDYENFDAIAEKVEALNANDKVVLRSDYAEKIAAILAELAAKPALTVTGAPNGTMLAMTLPTYVMTAAVDEGATVSWKLNNDAPVEGNTFTYKPKAFGEEYKIVVTSTVGTGAAAKTRTQTFEGKIIKATYQINSEMNGKIQVENNVIKVLENGIGWGKAEGKKVTIPDLVFLGNFSVSFDVKFTNAGTGNNDVMALFFNGADGSVKSNWVAVLEHSNVLETAVSGDDKDKYRPSMPSGTAVVDKVIHVRVIREIEGDVSYLTAQILDDNGRVLFTNDSVKNGKRLSYNYTGGIQLGINAENTQFEVSNLSVGNDTQYIDRTKLTTAIAQYSETPYEEADYDAASYRTYTNALSAANRALNTASTEAEIDAIIADLKTAFEGLTTKPIAYLEIGDTEFEYDGETYVAGNYKNYAAVKAAIEALKDDNTVVTISQYAAKVAEIIATLEEKVSLTVTSTLANGKHLYATLPDTTYTFTATVEAGATVTWKLNGQVVTEGVSADGKTLTITPAFGAYKVEAVASKDGENSLPVVYEGEFVKASITANHKGVTVENNVITSTSTDIGWGDDMGRKAVLDNLSFVGDVTVYFDIKFEEVKSDNSVLGIFFLNGKSESIANWAVINFGQKCFEVATVDDGAKKIRVTPQDGVFELNKTLHLKASRYVKNGKGYLSMWILDDEGNVIAENLGNNIAKDYAGPVMIGVQAENAKGTLTLLRVENNATVLNVASLNKAIEDTKGEYKAGDYTDETLGAYNDALSAAKAAYLSTEITTAAQFDEIVKALNDAHKNLVKIDVNTIKATTTETSFTYGEVVYSAEEYKNLTGEDGILAQVVALNETITAEMLVSEYNAAISALISELVLSLDVTVSGAPEGNLLVDSFAPYEITATTENAAISWTLNGEPVTEGIESETNNETKITTSKFTYTPAKDGEKFVITATATREVNGENKTATKTYEGSIIKTTYAVNEKYKDKISVIDNVINVSNTGGVWGDTKGEKVVLKNLNLHGEFVVTLDMSFIENAVGGLFLLSQDGVNKDYNKSYFAIINNGSRFIGINPGSGEKRYDIPEGIVDNGKTFTYRVSRIANGNSWALRAEILANDGTVIAGGSCDGCTGENISLGVQTENGAFKISNIKLVSGTVIDRTVMANAKAECDTIDKTVNPEYLSVNFSDEEAIAAYSAARQTIYDVYYNKTATPEEIAAAVAAFKPAYDALLETKIDVATVKAVTTDDDKFVYDGEEYNALYYKNIADVIAEIETLNADETVIYVSDYQQKIDEIIAKLQLSLEVTVTAVDGNGAAIPDNSVILYPAESYTFTAAGSIEGAPEATFTYAWKVDGEEQESTTNTLTIAPSQGTHEVTAILTYGEGENAVTVPHTFTIVFEKANVHTMQDFIDNRGATVDETDGTFKIGEGAPWGNWEGRKLVLDDLVLNGSFSVQMDVNLDKKVGGANVVTIHFLNADTLSRNNQNDNAIVGYGCICLHENPVRLETGGTIGKKQSDGDATVNAAMAAATEAGLFGEGKKFTVKLTVYRTADANGRISYDFSVLNSTTGEWITFSRENDWGGDFSGGFIVSMNIENAGVTLSNYKIQLLESGVRGDKNYVAGSAKSKAELYNKLKEYKEVVSSNYVNGGEFVNAYQNAFVMLSDNSTKADYATAVKNLKAAYTALEEKTVSVTVAGLDSGLSVYRGYDKFVPAFSEGVVATNVSWSYNFLAAGSDKDAVAEQVTTEDENLVLTAGEYTDVVLNLTVGEQTYAYTYQDFKVEDLKYDKHDKVIIEDGKVTVNENIAWDNPLKQLVFSGAAVKEFELSVDITGYNGGNVMCFRLRERDVRMVIRFDHDGGKAQIGFDEDGNDNYVTLIDSDKNALRAGELTVKIKRTRDANGEYHVTFALCDSEGTTVASVERRATWSNHFDSTTDLNITFENAHVVLENFKLMYN